MNNRHAACGEYSDLAHPYSSLDASYTFHTARKSSTVFLKTKRHEFRMCPEVGCEWYS